MRLRVKFSKTGKIRWTSHRDLARMWERAFRRTELPLAYSVGFSPRPKVSFGLALSTGHESVAEYLDLELDPARVEDLDLGALPARLTAALPDGVDVLALDVIDGRHESLQHEVTSTTFDLTVAGAPTSDIASLVARVLAAPSIVITRERKGQAVTDDVRPAILSVEVLGATESEGGRACTRLVAELATQPRGLRPAEFIRAVGPALEEVRVRRTHQWISRANGAREEPLPPDAETAPPVQEFERVS